MIEDNGKLKPTIYAESLPPAIFQPYVKRPGKNDTQSRSNNRDGLSPGGEAAAEDRPDA